MCRSNTDLLSRLQFRSLLLVALLQCCEFICQGRVAALHLLHSVRRTGSTDSLRRTGPGGCTYSSLVLVLWLLPGMHFGRSLKHNSCRAVLAQHHLSHLHKVVCCDARSIGLQKQRCSRAHSEGHNLLAALLGC